MRLLAIDTTGKALSLAVRSEKKTWTFDRELTSPHDETLIPRVDALLGRAGIKLRDLDGIAAATGPGRFTGIRVGMSYAAVAAAQLGVPALAVSHFEAIAHADPGRRIAAVVDGFRDEKFYQLFKRTGEVPKPAGVPVWVRAEDWSRISKELEEGQWVFSHRPPRARDLLGPAALFLGRKRRTPFAPLYIKPANFEKGKHAPRVLR